MAETTSQSHRTVAAYAAGRRVPTSPQLGVRTAIGLVLVCTAAVIGWAREGLAEQFWHSYLLQLTFFTSLGLGALFFVLIQHLTRAGWSVVLRRVAENMAATLVVSGVLFVPLLAMLLMGGTKLYSWNDAELVAGDALLASKTPYLNPVFFSIRTVVYFAVWIVLALVFRHYSIRQDSTSDPAMTLAMQRWSGPGTMAFAVTVTFASFDWLMSLDPHWFSAVYGVYFFSGCVVGFLAILVLALLELGRRGLLSDVVTVEHYHDLGKLLFGFVFFWAYIAFSQYLLIWYSNIPEETTWYMVRQSSSWTWMSLALLFGHFLVPFFVLMPRRVKRNRKLLGFWAAFLLAMHLIDLYWLVMPQLAPEAPPISLLDVLCFAGFGLVYWEVAERFAAAGAILPVGDPRLAESLSFHNV